MESDKSCQQQPQKAKVATLTSDKIDHKTKNVTRNNNEHFIIIKG